MKRRLLSISALAIICGISTGCNNSNVNISTEKAKEIALSHANLSQSEVNFVKANIDNDDGKKVYDVEFYHNYKEYDYKIDASNGDILEYDSDIEHYTIQQSNNNTNTSTDENTNSTTTNNNDSQSASTNQTTTNNQNASGNQTTSNATNITDAKAKEIALKHANVAENQVSYINAHLDYEDGIQVYDVNFFINNVEHSYEINAQTGDIISFEADSN